MAKAFLISICVKEDWAKIRCGKLNTNNYCGDHHLAATWILVQLAITMARNKCFSWPKN